MGCFHGIGLKSSSESFLEIRTLISKRRDYVFICTVVPFY